MQNFSLIDSHAHLTDEPLLIQIEKVLERARLSHISHIVQICTDIRSFEEGFKIQSRHPKVIAMIGANPPHDVTKKEAEAIFEFFSKKLQVKKIIGLGETGLDYHYHKGTKELQKQFLERYVDLAIQYRVPLVIHCREAFFDLFSIISPNLSIPVILHCFTGNEKEAEEALARNWWISISGIVTYASANPLVEAVKKIPFEKMLIETDAPYLAPIKYRGKTNEPSFIVETAKKIAEIKNASLEEVAKATSSNAYGLFFK